MAAARETIKRHNKKSDCSKVAIGWATSADMYRGSGDPTGHGGSSEASATSNASVPQPVTSTTYISATPRYGNVSQTGLARDTPVSNASVSQPVALNTTIGASPGYGNVLHHLPSVVPIATVPAELSSFYGRWVIEYLKELQHLYAGLPTEFVHVNPGSILVTDSNGVKLCTPDGSVDFTTYSNLSGSTQVMCQQRLLHSSTTELLWQYTYEMPPYSPSRLGRQFKWTRC